MVDRFKALAKACSRMGPSNAVNVFVKRHWRAGTVPIPQSTVNSSRTNLVSLMTHWRQLAPEQRQACKDIAQKHRDERIELRKKFKITTPLHAYLNRITCASPTFTNRLMKSSRRRWKTMPETRKVLFARRAIRIRHSVDRKLLKLSGFKRIDKRAQPRALNFASE